MENIAFVQLERRRFSSCSNRTGNPSRRKNKGNSKGSSSKFFQNNLNSMASNEVLPSYVEPCLSERSESGWRSVLDFGEYQYSPSDSPDYPRLTLVYNGKPLNVQSEFVHASLSGISIKHYYGKCYQEVEHEEEEMEEEGEGRQCGEDPFYACGEGEADPFDWFDQDEQNFITSLREKPSKESERSTSESGSFEYRENSVAKEGQPMCTLPRINNRNSFWNIHRPELCKLTWGQKYVSAATVTDHLHGHLTPHGQLCYGFHTDEERIIMLNRELDEYVRLKVIACPRELPPDEPPFNYREVSPQKLVNPKCKVRGFPAVVQNRYFSIKDDEEIQGKSICRSKEEFCLTIGKYVSKPVFVQSSTVIEEGLGLITPELSTAAEEESDLCFYNWFFYGEQSLKGNSIPTQSSIISETESETSAESCPPLMLDDLCRAAGKADFSDLRCDPDF